MKITATSVYVGPNIYALFPVIRHTLDLGVLEDWPTGRLGPAFTDALLDRLPRLKEPGCSYGQPGGLLRRIQATATGETRHIAVAIASDKEETIRILGDLGLPVPRQKLIYQARDAVAAAERIGYPVVVKPLDANHGRGVSIRLTDAEQVKTAFEGARQHSNAVIVENFIEGL